MQPLKSLKYLLLVHELIFVLLVTLAGAAGGYGIYQWHESSRESQRINRLVQEIQQKINHGRTEHEEKRGY